MLAPLLLCERLHIAHVVEYYSYADRSYEVVRSFKKGIWKELGIWDYVLRVVLLLQEWPVLLNARCLSFSDTGIGMTREELVESLGTIAQSGTAKFMKAIKVSHSAVR